MKRITLADYAPEELSTSTFDDVRAYRYKDVKVIEEHFKDRLPWIGKHKYVHCWWELENGYAVGWNENPAIGWSFPVTRLKK